MLFRSVLARLRTLEERTFVSLPDASEGLHMRLMRYARTEPTLRLVAEKTKTKRYTMSRIRRMILCAYLGISAEDSLLPPPYIRVLAFNQKGRGILHEIGEKSQLPIITKPTAAKKLDSAAAALFEKEAATTDLFVLAYPDVAQRRGGREWKTGPFVVS